MKMKTAKEIMKMENVGFEYDIEFLCGHVISSKIRDVTEKEIEDALNLYEKEKKCEHNIIQDQAGWLYDTRHCVICGIGLGTI